MTRYGLVVLLTTAGAAFLCARFGVFPGLVMSALLCLALSLIASGATPSRQKAAESDLTARAKRFQALGRKIRRREAGARLSNIGAQIHELIQHIRRDPKCLDLAEELIQNHLPKAQTLVEEYVRLVDQPGLGARHDQELAKMETTIELLESALKTQNRRLLDQDVDSFDLDRRGFEEMLRLDYTLDAAALDQKEINRKE